LFPREKPLAGGIVLWPGLTTHSASPVSMV
jgi:hypothetical protein